MMRHMLKSKIHRATVTEANIEYEGSVTIDRNLMDAADMVEYERVDLWNCTNGNRLTTYVIEGERGEGQICINGAAAHLMKPGDHVIIASGADVPDSEVPSYDAKRVFVDHQNVIRDLEHDSGVRPGGPVEGR